MDNFVKECRSKCKFVRKKLNAFKEGKAKLLDIIMGLGKKIRFISYDSRKVHEL